MQSEFFFLRFSPHAWGWTLASHCYNRPTVVFPTRVGVDRFADKGQYNSTSFPHTRGGGPCAIAWKLETVEFSPHAWGWTVSLRLVVGFDRVFPTRVGVDRSLRQFGLSSCGFPHTRGGGPCAEKCERVSVAFSPHAWGWTCGGSSRPGREYVFPTRVGVDLKCSSYRIESEGFPHTRGGGPRLPCLNHRHALFSPHAWGWTFCGTTKTTER